MLPGLRAQALLVVLALSSPGLCAAQQPPATAPGSVPIAPSAPIPVPPPSGPYVALLLPLNAPEYAAPAEAVRQGCQAAQTHDPKLALQIGRTNARPDSILAEYNALVARGATVVVGPMTRTGVSALAARREPGVPTVALNTPEREVHPPPWLYSFGLGIEGEARLVAHMAMGAKTKDAVVVRASTALAKRASQAFADEWVLLGGRIVAAEEFGPSTELPQMQQRLAGVEASMTFLAADATQARKVRPYLNNQMPVYGTSQINDERSGLLVNQDLAGIRFVDMPWLVQPDHPAVMVYPRSNSLSVELQRFYALGIDACRIAEQLVTHSERVRLDGVTGRITLAADHVFQREPVLAVIREGGASALQDQR
jgi:outer membrane PBP1 activator LpoA protein